ncbi:MAG: hypothetical protein HQL50_04035 [Magnetococcales bacterium]|nr:hypothetical protein [Magnetococcales bacterium]
MVSLQRKRDPYEIHLPFDVTVTVEPLTSSSMALCQARARHRLEKLEQDVRERKEAGLDPDPSLPSLDHDAERDGVFQSLLIKELAAHHITHWNGVVGEDDEVALPDRDTISALMDLYPVGERFFETFTLQQVLLNAAKNGSGPSAAGTSNPVEGQTTATDADDRGRYVHLEVEA